MIISKELLSLLGYGKVISEVEATKAHDMECLSFRTERHIDDGRSESKKVRITEHFNISLDELALKSCRWAFDNSYELRISFDRVEIMLKKDLLYWQDCIINQSQRDSFIAFDNFITFKACQWILDNAKD